MMSPTSVVRSSYSLLRRESTHVGPIHATSRLVVFAWSVECCGQCREDGNG
jgi:hypothetical protein